MVKVNLDPNDVELAYTIAQKRFIGNLRMNKGFSYGYDKNLKNQLYDGFLGALGEVSWAKWTNSYHNASYTDNLQRYEDSDFQDNIEIRTQNKKAYNFLLIRPGEKKGKYILIIKNDDKDFNFNIVGSFIYNGDMSGGVVDTMDGIDGTGLTLGLGDLVNVTAIADTAAVDLEVFVASK